MKELNTFRQFINEEDGRIYTGQSIERQLQALEDLQMAIEELQMSGVFDEGNGKAMKLLDQAYMMLYKALDVEGSLK